LPCSSTTNGGWANAIHWKATTTLTPTSSPIKQPSTPVTPPVSSPTSEPSLCSPPKILNPSTTAGYSCVKDGEPIGDSNDGGTSFTTCTNSGGDWTEYVCKTAEDYLSHVDKDTGDWLRDNWWAPKCCEEPNFAPTNDPIETPTKSPTQAPEKTPTQPPSASLSSGFCKPSSTLLSSNYAGHSCQDGLGDSNLGTTESTCAVVGGHWLSYTCEDAESFWNTVGGQKWEEASSFQNLWAARCCSDEIVTSFCPINTYFLGENQAAFTCADSLGDSLLGMTEADCASVGGSWNPYTCTEADNFWMSVGGLNWEYGPTFEPLYASKCCIESHEYGTRSIGSASSGYTELASPNGVIMNASSVDIWNTLDSFRFNYRRLNGNGVIYALVYKPSLTDEWVKSGLMIRESLDANAKNVAIVYTGNYGMLCQGRYSTGAETSYLEADWVNRSQPIWLAITRIGNKFDLYKSDDANNWNLMASVNVDMGSDIYVGMALSSHDSSKSSTGRYEYFGVNRYNSRRSLSMQDIDVASLLPTDAKDTLK